MHRQEAQDVTCPEWDGVVLFAYHPSTLFFFPSSFFMFWFLFCLLLPFYLVILVLGDGKNDV